jgi:hypothetical protein
VNPYTPPIVELTMPAVEMTPLGFANRIFASSLMMLASLALLVPGVALAVRYAFTEVATFREQLRPAAARRRSREVGAGRSWAVAHIWIAFFLGSTAAVVAIGLVASVVPILRSPVGTAAWMTALSTVCLVEGAMFWRIYGVATLAEARPRAAPSLTHLPGAQP